jgi:hypothetical protein
MDRRRFIRLGAGAGLATLGGGGILLVRRSYVRNSLASDLLGEALPHLKANSSSDLEKHPAWGSEEIRRYFHAKCLDVAGFVDHLCSDAFSERLARCASQTDREHLFIQAFCSRVVSEAEILDQVKAVASEIGNEVDASWSVCCGEMSLGWNARIPDRGDPISAGELTDRLGGLVRTELRAAALEASTGDRRPALGETFEQIGASAILLLPLARLGPLGMKVGIPLFVLLAAVHIWEYVAGLLDDRRGDHRAAISVLLARLGNRIGAEFEREIRLRLIDLHIWRAKAIAETTARVASARVGIL